jgi:Zn-dependent protease with chaperone function
MFANFIYFIVALLVLTLYEPLETPPLPAWQALAWFGGLTLLFGAYTHHQFRRLRLQAVFLNRAVADHRFGLLMTRHSILALVLFAADIWGLQLPSYLKPYAIFSLLPTLNALFFLAIFIAYLALVWYFSYQAHQGVYHTDISRGTYVYSNFAFSVPILLPWTLLFTISDLLRLLPFAWPKQLLDTAAGQIVYFLFFLLITAVFAPLMVQRFWRCRPLEAGDARFRIEALCRQAGVRYADIVYWPIFGGRMITAGVMGLVGRFRYILVTDALLQLLEPQEVDQVIAHEIGHVKRRHLLLYLLFFIGFMLISYAVYPLSYFAVFFITPLLNTLLLFQVSPVKAIGVLSGLLLICGVIIYFRFIFGYFMRNFERQADLYVFRLFPSIRPLVATFDKIVATSGQPADKPNWHHFSIQERVDFLKQCEAQPVMIERHDRKVRRGIAVYLTGFVITALTLVQFNQFVYDKSVRHLDVSDLQAYLAQKEEKTSADALLYFTIGNIYYEQKRTAAAAEAYEQAAALAPDNPDILNNLAWLLASERGTQLYDPPRALILAQKALDIKPAAYIWDTYAEALFATGQIRKAVEAQEKALAAATDNRPLYEERLARFRAALNSEGALYRED